VIMRVNQTFSGLFKKGQALKDSHSGEHGQDTSRKNTVMKTRTRP
jgi:hypothetical protein